MMDSGNISSIISYELATEKDVNLAPPVMKTTWVLLSISTVVVISRLVAKWKTTRRLYLDDDFMILALILGYLHAIFITISFHYGLGRHIVFLGRADMFVALKYGFISLAWSYLCPCAGRLSFCVFLLNIAATDPQVKKWPIWVVIVLQVLVNVTAIILLLSACGSHLDVVFNTDIPGMVKYCLPVRIQSKFAYFAGAINTSTDLFLTVLPGMMVAHAKLTFTRKMGVGSLLCLSILACIASIVRTIGAKALNDYYDYTYKLAPYVTWIVIELNIVMIVTSLPLLRPLVKESREAMSRFAKTPRKNQESWDDTISLRSLKGDKSQTGVGVVSLSGESSKDFASQQDPFSITRTVEVSVSHSSNDSPFIHAALVGLVQGEMMERLAGR